MGGAGRAAPGYAVFGAVLDMVPSRTPPTGRPRGGCHPTTGGAVVLHRQCSHRRQQHPAHSRHGKGRGVRPCALAYRRRSRSSQSIRPGHRSSGTRHSRSLFISRQYATGAALPFVQNGVSWVVVGGPGTSRRSRLPRGSREADFANVADWRAGPRCLLRRKNCV